MTWLTGAWIRKAIRSVLVPGAWTLLAAGMLMAACLTHDVAPVDVTVSDVIRDPYAVDGKQVRLWGLLHRSAEGDALYWHEVDVRQSIHSHGVSVHYSSPDAEPAELIGTYVVLEGIFKATHPARRGAREDDQSRRDYNGALIDARHVQAR